MPKFSLVWKFGNNQDFNGYNTGLTCQDTSFTPLMTAALYIFDEPLRIYYGRPLLDFDGIRKSLEFGNLTEIEIFFDVTKTLVRISYTCSQQLYVTLIFWKTFSLWQTVTRFWLNICQSLASEEIWQQSRILFGGTIPVGLVRILYAHERTKIFDEPSNL